MKKILPILLITAQLTQVRAGTPPILPWLFNQMGTSKLDQRPSDPSSPSAMYINETCPFIALENEHDQRFIEMNAYWSDFIKGFQYFIGECKPPKNSPLYSLINPQNLHSLMSTAFSAYGQIEKLNKNKYTQGLGINVPADYRRTAGKFPFELSPLQALFNSIKFSLIQGIGGSFLNILGLFYQPGQKCQDYAWVKNPFFLDFFKLYFSLVTLGMSGTLGNPFWMINPSNGRVMPMYPMLDSMRQFMDSPFIQSKDNLIKSLLIDGANLGPLAGELKKVNKDSFFPLKTPPINTYISSLSALLPLAIPFINPKNDFTNADIKVTFRNQVCLTTIALRKTVEQYMEFNDSLKLREIEDSKEALKNKIKLNNQLIEKMEAGNIIGKKPQLLEEMLGKESFDSTNYLHELCEPYTSPNNAWKNITLKSVREQMTRLNLLHNHYYVPFTAFEKSQYGKKIYWEKNEVTKMIANEAAIFSNEQGEKYRDPETIRTAIIDTKKNVLKFCEDYYTIAILGPPDPDVKNPDQIAALSPIYKTDQKEDAFTRLRLKISQEKNPQKINNIAKHFFITKLFCENQKEGPLEHQAFSSIIEDLKNIVAQNKNGSTVYNFDLLNSKKIFNACQSILETPSTSSDQAPLNLRNNQQNLNIWLTKSSLGYMRKQKLLSDFLNKQSLYTTTVNNTQALKQIENKQNTLFKLMSIQSGQKFSNGIIYQAWKETLPKLMQKIDLYLDYLLLKENPDFEKINDGVLIAEKKFLHINSEAELPAYCLLPLVDKIVCQPKKFNSPWDFLNYFYQEILDKKIIYDSVSDKPKIETNKTNSKPKTMTRNEQKFLTELFTLNKNQESAQTIYGNQDKQVIICTRLKAFVHRMGMSIYKAKIANAYCDTYHKITQQFSNPFKSSQKHPLNKEAINDSLQKRCAKNEKSDVNQALKMSAFAESSALKGLLKEYYNQFNCETLATQMDSKNLFKSLIPGLPSGMPFPMDFDWDDGKFDSFEDIMGGVVGLPGTNSSGTAPNSQQ